MGLVSQATFHDIKNRAESARKLRDRRRKSYLAMVAMCPVPKRDQLQRLEQAVGEAAKRANDAQEALDKCGWYFNKKIKRLAASGRGKKEMKSFCNGCISAWPNVYL